MQYFRDRREAGDLLAERIASLSPETPVVYALPRGGVPVAARVAARLHAPLDLLLVRKIGAPGNAEFAVGAVVEGAEPVFNRDVLHMLGKTKADFAATVEAKRDEIARRRQTYLAGRDPVPVAGRTAIVVDDGIATGATVRAALRGLRSRNPARVVLAVPVAPADSLAEIAPLVDEVVCLETPEPFYAVGAHYVSFTQTSDDEVAALMREAAIRTDGKEDT